jgi:hypothetical protein
MAARQNANIKSIRIAKSLCRRGHKKRLPRILPKMTPQQVTSYCHGGQLGVLGKS